MLDWLIEIDKELLLAINGWNSSFFDPIMVFITSKWSGIPIYIALLYMIFRKRDTKTAILMVAAVLLTFALTDQLAVHLFKNTIERFRPGWDPTVEHLIRMLEHKGGQVRFHLQPCGKLLWSGRNFVGNIKKEMVYHIHFLLVCGSGLQQGLCGQAFPRGCDLRSNVWSADRLACSKTFQIHCKEI